MRAAELFPVLPTLPCSTPPSYLSLHTYKRRPCRRWSGAGTGSLRCPVTLSGLGTLKLNVCLFVFFILISFHMEVLDPSKHLIQIHVSSATSYMSSGDDPWGAEMLKISQLCNHFGLIFMHLLAVLNGILDCINIFFLFISLRKWQKLEMDTCDL